jgi:8-oxo-dGTP pyrophosphatase MutT (NUDIX family)
VATPELILALRRHIGHAPLSLPSVTAVVLDDAGRVLLNQRSDDHRWSLLSGVLEPGEQPAAGAIREVYEETGVHVDVERILSVEALELRRITNGDQVYWFEVALACRAVSGEARVNDDESIDVAWFEPDAVPPLGDRQTRCLELALNPAAAPYFIA